MALQRVRTFLQGRISMQTVLVIPFLLQVLGMVGFVAYLCYHNSQQATQRMGFALAEDVSTRMSDRLQDNFNAVHKLLTLNQIDIQQRHIDTSNLDELSEHFWHQTQLLDTSTILSFTRPNGEYIGVGRDHTGLLAPKDTYILSKVDAHTSATRHDYTLNAEGRPDHWLKTVPHWDPRQQPGYQLALQNPQQRWTAPYPHADVPITTLDASLPVYRGGILEGVLVTHLLLPDLNHELQPPTPSKNGQENWQFFILDRSGHLLVSSVDKLLMVRNSATGLWEHQQIWNSRNPIHRAIAHDLRNQWPDLHQIQQVEHLQLKGIDLWDSSDIAPLPSALTSSQYFVEIRPYTDGHGLDWLMVTVIPGSQVLPEMQHSLQQTVFWLSLALVGAIALSIYTTRWITRPVLSLRDSANSIAQGNYNIKIASTPIQELRQLAFAFRQMAGQLQLSTEEMQGLNADLLRNRSQMETFLEAVPLGIVIYAADGTIAYHNQATQRLLGGQMPVKQPTPWPHRFYRAGTQDIYPDNQLPAARALRGEYTIANDLEIERGEVRLSVEVRATPIFAEDGTITHALVVFQDITARRDTEQLLDNYNRHLEAEVLQRTQTLEREILKRQQTEQALRESEATQRAILLAIPDLLLRLTGDGTYLARLNGNKVLSLSGDQDVTGKTIHDFMPPDLAEKRMHFIRRALRIGDIQIYEQQVELAGAMRDEENRVVKTGDHEVLVIVRDISDRKRTERALQQSENRNRAMLMAIPDLMFHVNQDGVYLGYMRSKSLLDILPKELDPTGHTMQDCMPPDIAQKQLNSLQRALETQSLQVYEQKIQLEDQVQWEEVRIMPYGTDEALFLIRDISDRKRYEADLQQANDRLEYLAQTDGLTQLANRRHFDHWLHKSWQELEQAGQSLALLLFDVDHFKRYNDYYGHQAGDTCLIQIAQAARQVIRYPTDLAARYGGEEFGVILPNTRMRGAVQVAERLRQAIHTLAIPHACSGVGPIVTISIGISILIPNTHTSPQDLITQADHALYLAKEQGRDRYILKATRC